MIQSLAQQVREFIIRPALQITNLWTESAEILVYGTGIVESGYNAIVQYGNPQNSGLGFFQMESSDFSDLSKWIKFQKTKPILNNLLAACYYDHLPSDPQSLVSNIKFAALMCRLHYLRVPYPLPVASDAHGFAEYHKAYYNSSLGAADISKNAILFQDVIDGKL